MTPALRRGGVVTVVAALLLLLTVGTAAAHSRLEGSDPPDGASLAAGPTKVSLRFNEQVQQGFATVTVVGPGNTAWQDGATTTAGDTVSVAVKPLGPAGVYRIGYRVVSEDGHPVTGSVSFTLTKAGSGVGTPITAGPTASAPDQGTPAGAAATDADGSPVWPWIVGAAVLVVAGVVAALRLGKG